MGALVLSKRRLLVTTALIEGSAGLAVLLVPGIALRILLGGTGSSLEALFLGRLLGAALLAIGLASWLGRADDGSPAQDAVLRGALLYNVVATVLLVYAGTVLQMAGFLLWIAVTVHAVMGAWCALSLRK
jgi:hypothetical protein